MTWPEALERPDQVKVALCTKQSAARMTISIVIIVILEIAAFGAFVRPSHLVCEVHDTALAGWAEIYGDDSDVP